LSRISPLASQYLAMHSYDLLIFFGRFHPLLVHLPIGFLLLAILMAMAEQFGWAKGLKTAIPFTLLLGVMSGVLACVLGLMLASGGGYNPDTLSFHKWAGIVTTLIAFVAWAISKGWLAHSFLQGRGYTLSLGAVLLGLMLTGHQGGNLTHGSDYLTEHMPFQFESDDPLIRSTPINLAEVQLFGDVVHPIIRQKCQSCHNESKQKGQLSFASVESYLKGGKHGAIIVPGDTLASELLVRVHLPTEDDLFMPPNGKTPLTDQERSLLSYWVGKAEANFDTLFMATDPSPDLLASVAVYLGLSETETADNEMIQLAEVDLSTLSHVTQAGFHIREMAAESNAYEVVLASNSDPAALETLEALAPNLLWLTLEKGQVTDAKVKMLEKCQNLRKLSLARNPLTDKAISALLSLSKLESLNLYGTQLTAKGARDLAEMPSLKKVYVWQTNISQPELEKLRTDFPQIEWVGGS